MFKINFLLKKFSNIEWSGPAWFRVIEETEQGWPTKFELIKFIPVDVGTAGGTEYDVMSMNKALASVTKWLTENYGEYLEDIYCGNIHSHHGMESYFSQTDKQALNDNAPDEGFWPSLIVSRSSKNDKSFGFSYKDQYGIPIFFTWNKESIENEDDFDYSQFEEELKTFVKPKEEVKTTTVYNKKWNETSTYTTGIFSDEFKYPMLMYNDVKDIISDVLGEKVYHHNDRTYTVNDLNNLETVIFNYLNSHIKEDVARKGIGRLVKNKKKINQIIEDCNQIKKDMWYD